MLNNTYNFVSNFSKLLNVQFYHNFFQDNLFRNLIFFTDDKTKQTLKGYGIILKNIENGFTLLYNQDPKLSSLSYAGELSLTFYFEIKLKTFLNITDIPYRNNQKFIFKNTQDLISEKLHANLFSDQNNTEPSSKAGITGQLSLKLNSKNQFFGSQMISEAKKELDYSVHFNSRKIVFRYNFYSKKPLADFEDYYITDEQNSFKLKSYVTRILANGDTVFSMNIEKQFLASENYTEILYLKKEDDFLDHFSMYLQMPKPNNISFDANEMIYLNDVFVKI